MSRETLFSFRSSRSLRLRGSFKTFELLPESMS